MCHHAIWVTDAPVASDNHSLPMVGGGLVFVPGNGPHVPDSRKVVGETIAEQTHRTIRNIAAIAGGAGRDWSPVVNTIAHPEHPLRDWTGFDRVYRAFLTQPYPARATTGTALKKILVDNGVVAVMPS